jgi:hypothetical protein
MANVTLRYKGLNCFGETDEISGSDEVYLFTIATSIENGKAVSRTEKHPVDRTFYDDVEQGASFGGPIAPCYFGPPQDLSLTVIVMEQDEGNPNAFKGKIDAAVQAAAAGAAMQGLPIPEIAQQLASSAINELLGSGDDNLGEVTLSFTKEAMLEEARKVRGVDQNVSFTFLTEHTGQTSTYRAFFDVVEEAVPVPVTHRVAFNPQDRFVVVIGDRIFVINDAGHVFAHVITGDTVGPALRLAGPPVAFPQHRFVAVMGNRILVTVPDGAVFAHDITGDTIVPAVRLAGPRVAFNPFDHFVAVMGSRILVILNGGQVFAHDINGNTIGPAVKLTGAAVAFNPQDKFVVVIGNRIFVIDDAGRVFAQAITGNTIGPATRLDGPPVAFPQRRFVTVMGSRILVTVPDGAVFAHDITGNTVAPAVRFS